MWMLRLMCSHTKSNKIKNDGIQWKVQIAHIKDKIGKKKKRNVLKMF